MHESLRRLVTNAEVLTDQRAADIAPQAVTAFGIRLASGIGKASELVQLLEFAQLAAERAVAHYVAQVHYDADGACFVLHDDARPDDAAAGTLLACATATIARFAWLDGSRHGTDVTS